MLSVKVTDEKRSRRIASDLTLCLIKNLHTLFDKPLTIYTRASQGKSTEFAKFLCPYPSKKKIMIKCKKHSFTAVEGSFCELHCQIYHPTFRTCLEGRSHTYSAADVIKYVSQHDFGTIKSEYVLTVLLIALNMASPVLALEPMSGCENLAVLPARRAPAQTFSPARSLVQYANNFFAWGVAFALWWCRHIIMAQVDNFRKNDDFIRLVDTHKVYVFEQLISTLGEHNQFDTVESTNKEYVHYTAYDNIYKSTVAFIPSQLPKTAQLFRIQSHAPRVYLFSELEVAAADVNDVLLLSSFTWSRMPGCFINGVINGLQRMKTAEIFIDPSIIDKYIADLQNEIGTLSFAMTCTRDERSALQYALELKDAAVDEYFYKPFEDIFLIKPKTETTA